MAARNGRSSGGSSHFTWEASEWPTFLHLDIFDDEWSDLGLGDDDLQELQSAILASPERYPIIRGKEGLRRIRFTPSREARAGLIALFMSGSASSGSSQAPPG